MVNQQNKRLVIAYDVVQYIFKYWKKKMQAIIKLIKVILNL